MREQDRSSDKYPFKTRKLIDLSDTRASWVNTTWLYQLAQSCKNLGLQPPVIVGSTARCAAGLSQPSSDLRYLSDTDIVLPNDLVIRKLLTRYPLYHHLEIHTANGNPNMSIADIYYTPNPLLRPYKIVSAMMSDTSTVDQLWSYPWGLVPQAGIILKTTEPAFEAELVVTQPRPLIQETLPPVSSYRGLIQACTYTHLPTAVNTHLEHQGQKAIERGLSLNEAWSVIRAWEKTLRDYLLPEENQEIIQPGFQKSKWFDLFKLALQIVMVDPNTILPNSHRLKDKLPPIITQALETVELLKVNQKY